MLPSTLPTAVSVSRKSNVPLLPTEFRIQHHRNIVDSGWVRLDRLTALLGRNESGKTTILDALHKFNPAISNVYDIEHDPPRHGPFQIYNSPQSWPFCSIRFKIDADTEDQLRQLHPTLEPLVTVTCTRRSDNSLEIEWPTPPFEEPWPQYDLFTAFATLANGLNETQPSSSQPSDSTSLLLERTEGWRQWLAMHGVDLRAPTKVEHESILLNVSQEAADFAEVHPEFLARITDFRSTLASIIHSTSETPSLDDLNASIEEMLPLTYYYEEYPKVPGVIGIAHADRAVSSPQPTQEDAAIAALFTIGNISPQDLLDSNPPDPAVKMPKARRNLTRAAGQISTNLNAAYSQRPHTIEFSASGQRFDTFIADTNGYTVETNLDERSEGFRSFLSMYLLFFAAKDTIHKDAILLLDEPGLHLHPAAQQDLVSLFEALSGSSTIVYSTHSPFMLRDEAINSIRSIIDRPDGTIEIFDGSWPTDHESIFPLRALVGYKLLSGMVWKARSVLLEGHSDLLYLTSLNRLCKLTGRRHLPEDVYLVPCRGARNLKDIATLFHAEGLTPIILLDHDQPGKSQHDSLRDGIYSGNEGHLVLLSEILGTDPCEIEDLVGEHYMLKAVSQLLGRPLTLTGTQSSQNRTLVSRIIDAATRLSITMEEKHAWTPKVAKLISIEWDGVPSDGVPRELNDVLGRAEGLFEKIDKIFDAAE